jgi:hypothetical protein
MHVLGTYHIHNYLLVLCSDTHTCRILQTCSYLMLYILQCYIKLALILKLIRSLPWRIPLVRSDVAYRKYLFINILCSSTSVLSSLLYNGYRVFPRGKVRLVRAADHSPPSNAAVMEEQSYTSTHPLGHTRPLTGSLVFCS